MRISAFNRSCERKQSRIYPSRSLKKVAISFDHDPILFSAANPADEVFGRHSSSIVAPSCRLSRSEAGLLFGLSSRRLDTTVGDNGIPPARLSFRRLRFFASLLCVRLVLALGPL